MVGSELLNDAFLPGLWAGYALAVPVGALAVLLVSLTARTSLRVGASAALGVATADGLYAALAVLGGAALSRAVQPVTGPLRWAAAAILLSLAVRTALATVRERGRAPDAVAPSPVMARPHRAYLGFLGLTLLNPWTIVYFSALVLAGPGGGGANGASRAAFVAAVVAASASWQLLLATSGAVLGRALTGPRGRLITGLVSSVVIGALAVALVA
ncbi:LysE family transporter [Streptomyces endophyticus]|uniref:LysE family transporter n=1 Tax=Streptomyces endophyticus TaxID=714166 RepID=A0ABU6F0H6_9ACTN|nr:LysE family transporter [Streptomyces endophyticus]MEB8336988.1 LysE family transporter [Streptomyces endophyticus]